MKTIRFLEKTTNDRIINFIQKICPGTTKEEAEKSILDNFIPLSNKTLEDLCDSFGCSMETLILKGLGERIYKNVTTNKKGVILERAEIELLLLHIAKLPTLPKV